MPAKPEGKEECSFYDLENLVENELVDNTICKSSGERSREHQRWPRGVGKQEEGGRGACCRGA